MIYGIGIDVVEVDRIEGAIERQGAVFVEKIFTEKERAYCERQRRPAMHYAARFAAKEAIAKALGTGICKDLGWLDIEVMREKNGAPKAKFTERVEKHFQKIGISRIQISLTHARDYAAANAVALSRTE